MPVAMVLAETEEQARAAAKLCVKKSCPLASAGTLGILIPPSITMVVYAVAADASIIRIFLAGFLPGLNNLAYDVSAAVPPGSLLLMGQQLFRVAC